jgi:hypothetical protein
VKRQQEPAGNESLPDVVEALVGEIGAQLRGDGLGLMPRLEQLGAARASRLDAAHRRLAEHLGEDDPRVVALVRRRAALEEVGANLSVAVRRARKPPPTRPQEWVAQGFVSDDRGRPLAGLTVRVIDREGQLADVLGSTETEDDGGFRLAYHQRVFGKETPELVLRVEDPTGRELASSEELARPEAGRTDLYEVAIPAVAAEHGKPRRSCQAVTQKGERCRNPAVPGEEFCARHLGTRRPAG